MSTSGEGTREDPVVVDTWKDFLDALTSPPYDKYIVWAERRRKVIDSVTINSVINSKYVIDIDFNEWTFDEVNITISGGGTQDYDFVGVFNNDSTLKFYNLTINNLNILDPRVSLFYKAVDIYNCFCYEMNIGELNSNYAWWQNGQGRWYGDNWPSSPLLMASCYECILTSNSKDYSVRFPLARNYYNCEVKSNYTWTQNGALDYWVIAGGMNFINSYISGKIDVSKGKGSWSIFATNEVAAQISSGTIIDFETIVSANCTLINGSSTPGVILPVGNTTQILMTSNNGNNYQANKDSTSTVYEITAGDMRNPDVLSERNFPYYADDEVRYPQYSLSNHAQDWTYRHDPVINNGIPFLPFWKYGVRPDPSDIGEVDNNPYIIIYDMETPQDGFNTHGLAILRPTQCKVVEELNGVFNLQITHPKDPEEKYKYILEMNIIKALGQLFVIQRVDEVITGRSEYVSAYAEHISYILNDRWIFPPFSINAFTGQGILDSIMAQATDMGGEWQTLYNFELTTTLDPEQDFRDWYEMKEGVTPYEMILGGNGFIAKIGGEVYRDNFKLSIRERMENAEDDAFEIAVGYNLRGIKRTVDLSTFCSYFRAYDVSDGTYDTWWAVSWDPSTLPRAYPRNVVRSQNFYYDHEEYKEGQLERDGFAFFNQNLAPLISYELNVQDLRRNPEYKGFENNYRFKVGDRGRVWDERLNSWIELEITRTEKDAITGDTTKVVIGTQRSFTRPSGYTPFVPRGSSIANVDKVIEGNPPLTFYSAGVDLRDWVVYGAAGGVVAPSANIHYSGIEWAYYYPPTGERTVGPLDDQYISSDAPVRVKPSTTYAYSVEGFPIGGFDLWVLEYSDNASFITGQYFRRIYPYNEATVFTTSATTAYVIIMFGLNGHDHYDANPEILGNFMLSESSSTEKPEYVAPGYALPITITGEDSQSHTVAIVLDAPLYENDSISLEDTGIDIPTYRGTNVLTINTEVTPRVKIKYREVSIGG